MPAKTAKPAQTNPGELIRRFALQILREARSVADDPARSDAVLIHDIRKALKRWRALLRLLEPLLGEEAGKLRRQARDLARELGGARNWTAALDALDDIEAADRALAPGLKSLRERIETARRAAERATLDAAMRARIRTMLTQASVALDNWPMTQIGAAGIAAQLARAYARARRAIPPDWQQASGQDLHMLRQRLVVHRYQMDLVQLLAPKPGRARVRQAQKLRDSLGHHQDLDMLAQLAEPRRPLGRWRQRLTPHIAARKHKHAQTARRLADRLFAEKPKAFRCWQEELWAPHH